MKIINKDDCLQSLNNIKMYGGINIPLSAFDTFDRLIEEHFSPQSLKFEELHENMWVYDVKAIEIRTVNGVILKKIDIIQSKFQS